MANQSAGTVSNYQINISTGVLTPLAGQNTVPSVLANPFAIAADPQRQFLLVAGGLPGQPSAGAIAVFRINSTTGALTQVSGSPFVTGGTNPSGKPVFQVVVHPNDKFAYATNSGSNSIAAFTFDATSGALAAINGSPFATNTTDPLGAAIPPSGQFLYVDSGTANLVEGFSLNTSTGIPTSQIFSPLAVTGNDPVAETIFSASSGNTLYIANFNSKSVSAFTLDATTGQPTQVLGSPFVTGVGTNPCSLAAAGNFLYVANCGSGNVSGFTVNSNGSLTPLAGFPAAVATTPVQIAATPSGSFLVVVDQSKNEISSWAINASFGTLTKVVGSTVATGAGPRGIAIVVP